ncbi:MAG: aminotransferase class I/II-fold pyridoxal phosphate-dependent enzyme [Microthrixaceae bacterium]|nr:aminotransferase class I/II-fold pyridoxal phosphate-dependent enzyme [Microthrixaceae bacterium]
MRRIPYAGSVHDEEEIEAVVAVLSGGPTALRIGRHVRAFEAAVAALFGKAHGVMVNSGSSALELAVELLALEPGDEVLTSPLTFSTDLAPLVRRGLVPVFVDVEPDTYNLDAHAAAAMVGPRTRAILAPDLIGNAPDWDVLRSLADAHDLQVLHDSCDALGSTLRGNPTGTRADVSVTSFALSHIITAAGTGGMVCVDDAALADRALLLRRWGRRSEVTLFGSGRGSGRRFFSEIEGDLEYDDLFIFDEVGWNFEPSELSAAFGEVQLRKLPQNLARRRRNFERLHEGFGRHPDVFVLPRTLDGLETAWHMFPLLLRADAGVRRADFQAHMEAHGVDTRMVWTGNVLRQPAFSGIGHRAPDGGLPNADRVMEWGVVLPSNHGLDDDDVDHVVAVADEYLARGR